MEKVKKAAALKYEKGRDGAPVIVASGRGYIAEKIIDKARENSIPMFKDDNTAEILCSTQVGSEIPEALYQVIAEIYAIVFRMEQENKNKL